MIIKLLKNAVTQHTQNVGNTTKVGQHCKKMVVK